MLVQETIALLQRNCPSLEAIEQDRIILQLDPTEPQLQTQNVKFKVLPEVWPLATSANDLPIIHASAEGAATDKAPHPAKEMMHVELVEDDSMSTKKHWSGKITRPAGTAKAEESSQSSPPPPTWDDLVKQGALLGVQGYTDRAKSNL